MIAASQEPDVPGANAVEGVTFRHYRNESDITSMLAVHEGCRIIDRVDPFSVCYRVPNLSRDEYIRDVAISLSDGSDRNILIAEAAGQIVAHSRLEWWREWDSERNAERYAYLSRGWVLPEWRGRGIGTALLHWAEIRSLDIDRGRVGVPGEFAANASDGEQDAIALLHNEGYQLRFLSPELAYDDFSNLPAVTMPPGLEIRPLEAPHHREVARAIIESNADSDWTQEQLELWIAREEAEWTKFVAHCDPELSRIGWQNGTVVGLHLCRRIGMVGDVANVAVRPAYRMQGIARALMFHCLHAMRQHGLKTARLYTGIGTDRHAPPTGPFRMYQGFGFRLFAFHNRYRKPIQIS